MRGAGGAQGQGPAGENQRLLPRERGPAGQVQQPGLVSGLQVRTRESGQGPPGIRRGKKGLLVQPPARCPAGPALCADGPLCKNPQAPSRPASQKRGQLLTTK